MEILPKEEEDYKTIQSNPYADRLIERLEQENAALRQEIEEGKVEIVRLTVRNEELKRQVESRPLQDPGLSMSITSPMEARLALENASKNKDWIKGRNEKA